MSDKKTNNNGVFIESHTDKNGKDAIDWIKAGKKIDFILVDDEMKEMFGFMTLKGM